MADLKELRSRAIKEAIQAVKESIGPDDLIVQAVRSTEDITRTANILAKRLRDWYALYNPEFEHACQDHEQFVDTILKKDKAELLQELKVSTTMGQEVKGEDLDAIKELTLTLKNLQDLRAKEEAYLEQAMKKVCPNVQAVAGTLLGAKLLELAGSLKRLAILPSSTVQLLGAEKALFRHIVTGAKVPKHGVLILHPLVAASKEKGRAARLLADKLSMAARIDYFKGEFCGDVLLKEVEAKLQ